MTNPTVDPQDAEAVEALEASVTARALSDDPLIAASLSVVDAYSLDLRDATENQRWAIKVAHKHGASLRQLAEVSGLHRNTISKIVNAEDPAAA